MENRLSLATEGKEGRLKLVYLCSPLRGNYEENMKRVTEYCKTASELGVITFAPHLYFTQFYRDTIPEEREKGLQLGLAMLDKCEELWVMGNRITQEWLLKLHMQRSIISLSLR